MVPIVVGIGAGLAAVDIARYRFGNRHISAGGSPHGTLTGTIMGFRNVIAFAVAHLAHPGRLAIAYQGELDARNAEQNIFYGGTRRGYDNGPDAFRHTYASALICFRLIRDGGMSPDDAARFTREAGLAHERDSMLTGRHFITSRAMDVHNNDVGIALAVEHARRGVAGGAAGDRTLGLAVFDAIRSGRTVVLQSAESDPRPSRPDDLRRDAPSTAAS